MPVLKYIFALAGFVLFFVACKNETGAKINAGSIGWMDTQEALQLPNAEGKRYIVQIETDSCKWCKVMDDNTYSFKPLVEFINDNYIPVKLNTLHKDTIVFKGEAYGPIKIGNLDIHGLADKWLNYWYNYPTTIIFDKDFNQIMKFSGYKDPDIFLLELKKL